MPPRFEQRGYLDFCLENRFVAENVFLKAAPQDEPLPAFEASRELLPQPRWDGHDRHLACYWKAWEIAFRNLRRPAPGSGFVSNFIDTAFNGCTFMWDSAFMTMFGRYGRRAFDFGRTLDNFYARQHRDGSICREIDESNGLDRFHRFDPSSTGPNVLPWAEWESFLNFGDRERLARVFPPLVAYHQFCRAFRTWPDGSYWTNGLASGMDNQPRIGPPMTSLVWHGGATWIDACLQALLSARLLLAMAGELGRRGEVEDLAEEAERLASLANDKLWDERTGFYHDRLADGRLAGVKTVGAYWALLAGIVPPSRLARFLAHLEDPAEFARPHRVPSLSADHPEYRPDGGYWRGGVWPSTDYMILRGLSLVGRDRLAHEIALNHVDNVVRVCDRTGTLWENYAPESAAPGKPAKPDFVGWTGLSPVAIVFEYAFGLRPDVPAAKLVWDVRLLDGHGVKNYPYGPGGRLDLDCAPRSKSTDKPQIRASSTVPVTLELRWDGGSESVRLGG